MARLETYRDRFSEGGWKIFEGAIEESRRRGQNCVTVEHLTFILIEEKRELFQSLLRSVMDDPRAMVKLVALVDEAIEAGPKHEGAGVRIDVGAIKVCQMALARVRSEGRRRIEATDLFIALLADEGGPLREKLRSLGAKSKLVALDVRDIGNVIGVVRAASRDIAPHKYEAGEMVFIRTGAFASFTGQIKEIDEAQGTVKVFVQIFGRRTAIDLKIEEVAKIPFAEE